MSEAHDGEPLAEDTSLESQVEEAPEGEQPGDDAAAPAEAQAEAPKPKQTAQERIAELTAKRREAERDAEYWKAKALQTPAQEARQPQAHAADEDPEPDPADYEYGDRDVRYIEDRAVHRATQTFQMQMANRDAQLAVQTKLQTFRQRTAEQFPDGEPEGLSILKAMPTLSQAITDVILTSENGPRLADHLGKNTRELNRLSALPPHLQAYELAKIEMKLSAPAAAKTATDAPPPTPQVRGSGGRFGVAPDTSDFAAFEKLADASG